jgi:hypothetical protein
MTGAPPLLLSSLRLGFVLTSFEPGGFLVVVRMISQRPLPRREPHEGVHRAFAHVLGVLAGPPDEHLH